MPLGRGETIGTAFVRILADGSDLDDSVERAVRKGSFDVAGSDMADETSKGYAKRMEENDKIEKSLHKKFKKAFTEIAADKKLGDKLQGRIAAIIQEGLSDFDPKQAERLGQKIGDLVADGFAKTGKVNTDLRQLFAQATKAIDAEDEAMRRLEESSQRLIDKQFELNQLMKDKQFAKETAEHAKQVRKLAREVEHAEKAFLDEEKAARIAHAMNARFDKDMLRSAHAMNNAFTKAAERRGREDERLRRAHEVLLAQAHRLNEQWDRENHTVRNLTTRLRSMKITFGDISTVSKDVAEGVGKIFGKGSRNDFLNIVGAVMQMVTRLTTGFVLLAAKIAIATVKMALFLSGKFLSGLGKLALKMPGVRRSLDGIARAASNLGSRGTRSIGNFTSAIATKFPGATRLVGRFIEFIGKVISKVASLARTGLEKVLERIGKSAEKAGSEMGKMGEEAGAAAKKTRGMVAKSGAGIAALLAAVAVSLPSIVTSIGVVTSAVSGLVAGAIALVSSLAFAAAGALVPLAGLAGPLLLAISAIGLSFIGLDKKTKKLISKTLKPLKDAFQDLGDETRKGLFTKLEPTVKALEKPLKSLKPLFKDIGTAVGNVGLGFAKGLNTQGFKDFIKAMKTGTPKIIEGLGASVRHALGGLGGIFRAALPFAQRFVRWLERATGEFSKFTNSKEGQGKLTRFFTRATDSAQKLWDLLKSFGGLIATVFSAGKTTGDDLIVSLTDKLVEWTQWLKDNPDALDKFFANGKQIAEDVGNLVIKIGDLFDKLDTPENRARADKFIKNFERLVGAITVAVKTLQDIFNSFDNKTKNFGKDFTKSLDDMWESIKSFFSDTKKAIKDWVQKTLLDFAQWVKDIIDFFKHMADVLIGHSVIPDMLDAIVTAFKRLPGRIFDALKGLAQKITKPFVDGFNAAKAWVESNFIPWVKGLPARIAGAFKSGATFIRDHFSAAWAAVKTWWNGSFLPWVRALPGAIRSSFTGSTTVIRDWFNTAWSSVKTWWSASFLPWVRALPGRISGAFGGTTSFLRDLFEQGLQKLKTWWMFTFMPWVHRLPGQIASAMRGVGTAVGNSIGGAIKDAMNSVFDKINDRIRQFNDKSHGVLGTIPTIPRLARGAVLDKATLAVLAERGPEAVVPLNRPLSQVDPAVRELSAIAQGKATTTNVDRGKVVNVGGLTVITPTEDPVAVAQETVNKLVGAAYI